MQDDKISFDTFLKSEHCLPDSFSPRERVFRDTKRKGFDWGFPILILIAAASIALCIFYYQNAFEPIDTSYKVNTGDTSSSFTQKDGNKININTADIETLCTIKYIGKSKALEIVSYRIANGPFKDISDIKNVKGIGDTTFNKIKDSICI